MTVNVNAGNSSSIRLVEQSSVSAPSGSAARVYVNNAGRRRLCIVDSSGVTTFIGNTSGSGTGITFPSTQDPSTDANTLDDYDEGTWTPVVRGTTTAGTGTYTTQTGRYTKIGRQVFVEFRVAWTGLSGAVGTMAIGGLPFNAANSGTFPGVAIGELSNLGLTASNVATIQVLSNTDYFRILQYPVGGGASATVALDTTGGDISASATYTV